MFAGHLVGADISINEDGKDTVATVEIYPHSMEVRVPREENYKVLLEKIDAALQELYFARGTQF